METMETNVIFPDKNITRKKARSAGNNSFTINADMKNDDKLKIIKSWYEEYKASKSFDLFLIYNEKTYNLYSFSLKGGDIDIYFTYSDETNTYGYGMKVMNINNEFPTFVSDNPEFDLSTLVKQEGTGGKGTDNYDELENKPSINDVPLVGNLTTKDLGISSGESTPTYEIKYNDQTTENKAIVKEVLQKIFTDNEYINVVLNDTSKNIKCNLINTYIGSNGWKSLYFQTANGGVDSNTGGGKVYIYQISYTGSTNYGYSRAETYELLDYNSPSNTGSSYKYALATNNTKEFTPTGDYNPATKKYVDDALANIETGGGGDTAKLYFLDFTSSEWQTVYENYENNIPQYVLYNNGDSQFVVTRMVKNSSTRFTVYYETFKEYNSTYKRVSTTGGYIIFTINASTNMISGKTNSYFNYDLATTTYVDNQIGNINTLLEAI